VDAVDAGGKLHEYEGVVEVVSINGSALTYSVISITEKSVVQASDSNATSLTAFIDDLATGFSKYTDAQIGGDSYLSSVAINIQAANPLVLGAQMVSVYTKMVGLATAYLIFY
jgi:hypothetical protein